MRAFALLCFGAVLLASACGAPPDGPAPLPPTPTPAGPFACETSSIDGDYIRRCCDTATGNLIYEASTYSSKGGVSIAVLPGGCRE